MSDLNVDGMAIAPGVVETIISIAAKEVEGVASIGPSGAGGLRAVFSGKPSTQGIEVDVDENDQLHVAIRIDVYYGYVLPEVADAVRTAIADAVASQIGVGIGSIDVFIDGIQFAA